MGSMSHTAVIRFQTYNCRINQSDTGQIHCFKYNTRGCDWAIFQSKEQDEASDYVLTPLPTHYYYVDFQDE